MVITKTNLSIPSCCGPNPTQIHKTVYVQIRHLFQNDFALNPGTNELKDKQSTSMLMLWMIYFV